MVNEKNTPLIETKEEIYIFENLGLLLTTSVVDPCDVKFIVVVEFIISVDPGVVNSSEFIISVDPGVVDSSEFITGG